MVDIGIGTAFLAALLGYAVDFLGIIFLMVVIMIMGKIMHRETKKKKSDAIDLGSINVPEGTDPKKAAVIFAALAEEERWGHVQVNARTNKKGNPMNKVVAAIAAAIAEEEEG